MTEFASPYFDQEDQNVWEGRTRISIDDYTIIPKQDFSTGGYYSSKYRKNIFAGFVVVKGNANAVPGAGWFHTVKEAKLAIHTLLAVGEKGFHGMWSAMRVAVEVYAPEPTPEPAGPNWKRIVVGTVVSTTDGSPTCQYGHVTDYRSGNETVTVRWPNGSVTVEHVGYLKIIY